MTLTTDPGYRLTYIVARETWYADKNRQPELNIVKAADGGGCAWEFNVTDYTDRLRTPAIRLDLFDDAFPAFAEIPEFFAELGRCKSVNLDDVREILDGLGFIDATARERS